MRFVLFGRPLKRLETVRPGASFTNKLKTKQVLAGGLPKTAAEYEEDHRVPLCAGGNPKDERNLWPQPRFGQWTAKDKDESREIRVPRAVQRQDQPEGCAGVVPRA